MSALRQISASNVGLPPDSYIYKILSTAPRQDALTYSRTEQFAIISSDNSLRYIDANTLSLFPDGIIPHANHNLTCLERANDESSNIVATAGRDGFIRFWDRRSRQTALDIVSPHKLISSLVCDTANNFIACGIENPEDGPGVSPVYVWDQRKPSAPTRSYIESHTDTITSLQLHPSHPSLLLSASTDGLVNIFDTSQAEEDDALYQVINHSSAIAHAGFMYPGTDIYAIGTDETLGFYALQSQKEEEEEPAPKLFGDVREALGCEYLVKMHWVGERPFLAAGKHSESWLDIIPVVKGSETPLAYSLDTEKRIRLPGAHGEEVVRDMFTDVHTRTTFSCGEDGTIRAWKAEEEESMDVDEEAESSKEKKKKKSKDGREKRKEKKEKKKAEEKEKKRYKPY